MDYKNVFDNIVDAMLIIDKEYSIVGVNDAFLRFISKKKDEVMGKKCYEIVHGTKKLVNGCPTCRLLKTKKQETAEFYDARLKKSLLISSSPLDEHGPITRIVHYIRDITGVKKAEELIKEDGDLPKSVFNIAQVIMLVLNPKGKIVTFNPYMELISGYRLEEVKGKDWFSTFLPGCNPDEIRKVFKKAIRGIQTKGNINPIITKDGKKIDIEWYDEILKDKDGKIFGLLAIGLDITGKKKTEEDLKLSEETLKESEERYRMLVETANDMITVAQDGMVKFANEKMIDFVKVKYQELAKKPFINFIHPDDRKLVFERHKKRIAGENPPNIYKFRIVDNDGKIIWVEINAVMIRWKGRPATLNFMRDVNDQVKTEQEKEKLQHKLKQYVRRLEIRVKELERDKVNLTDKEKLVFWGIARYPNDNDNQLSKRLRIKRSTITAIRNRLRKGEMYDVVNIPNFKALGAELITMSYGRFNVPAEKRKELAEKEGFSVLESSYSFQTDNEFVKGFISKNMVEFERNMNFSMNKANKYSILKKYRIVHFLYELDKVYKFCSYSGLLKKLFEVGVKEKAEEEQEEEIERKLNKNEKKVLLKLIEYPEISAYDLSFKVDLTRATCAKIKNRLIKDGFVKAAIIPDIAKLGVELMILNHIRDTRISDDAIKYLLEKNPYLVFLAAGNREVIGLSFFKDYNEYTEFMKKYNIYEKGIVSEKPIVFKLHIKDFKSKQLNLLDITNKLLQGY